MAKEHENQALFNIDIEDQKGKDAATESELLDLLLTCSDTTLQKVAQDYIDKQEMARDAKQIRDLQSKYAATFKK